jgi:hypothetical protein
VRDLDVGCVAHDVVEHGQEVAVELERHHVRTGLGQRDGERPDAGTDLEHAVAGAHVGEPHDLAGEVRVGEEVLAQGPAGPAVVRGEEVAHGARGQ